MPHAIRIRIGDRSWTAELNDTVTAASIREALPVEGQVSRWGQEIYFAMPGKASPSKSADRKDPRRIEMEPGEVAYWAPGNAFCIFWGQTPASTGDKPVAASPVVPVGRLTGPLQGLDDIDDDTLIRIETL